MFDSRPNFALPDGASPDAVGAVEQAILCDLSWRVGFSSATPLLCDLGWKIKLTGGGGEHFCDLSWRVDFFSSYSGSPRCDLSWKVDLRAPAPIYCDLRWQIDLRGDVEVPVSWKCLTPPAAVPSSTHGDLIYLAF